MSPIFTVIVIILIVLAILDLVVGVSNDAVNFLNSALGAKVASLRTILIIAALGILIGVVTSNGMMEVARNGVFHPEMFSFSDIMILFVGMMMADVILLNTFNSLGLPTSTTVSLIFELLGSAVAVALFKIWSDSTLTLSDLGLFINSGKALVIISGILISVVLSFAVGSIIMYLSRIIFTFRYAKSIERFGSLWCGISLVGIIYFAIIKGLKSSGLITPDVYAYINDNLWYILLLLWGALSVLLYCFQRLKINILKVTILSGTFALALAFAGNDLVNFIGVPIAGIDSYIMVLNSGNEQMLMGDLAKPAQVSTWILILSGLIMVITLFFSRSAMKVAETQLNLSSQNSEDERFGSSLPSRSLVRFALTLNSYYNKILPDRMKNSINKRFTQLPEIERGAVSYDNIRAVVNLTAASILICVGTSLKLPLSTTYVVFMVAMGSSLADRAWGRDSAVYRITGVMVVISGWFLTAFIGFVMALLIGVLLMWGGWISLIVVGIICGYALCHNLIFKPKKQQVDNKPLFKVEDKEEDVLYSCTEQVCHTMEEVTAIYNHMLVALFTENRRVLKETVEQSEEIYQQAHKRKYEVLSTLKKLQDHNIETGHFYVQVVDYLSEVSKALLHCTRPAYEHINNNHKGLTEDQIVDLKEVNDHVDIIFSKINEMLRNKDFSKIDDVMIMREELFNIIANSIKNQIKRLKTEPMSTKASTLYLNILNETKTMVLQSRNLLKSQAYFLNEIHAEHLAEATKS
ncbi:MAG: inorganic phosphate transporter [Muribaculaceae bacterium]|nr:inorganic phosphate transporter [Muribaculaceae bacterium]